MSWERRRHSPGMCAILLAAPLLVGAVVAWPQQLDERELDSTANRSFHFQSFEGRPAVVQSVVQIEGIGEVLSRGLNRGLRGDYFGKYSVIRAWQPSDTTLLGADIIVFGQRAGVDDVRNVERIVAGYLAGAFRFPRARASELAVLVTRYNAAYRGNVEALARRYTPRVMSYLSADDAGLAANYRDWPGKTRLIIPLAPAANASGGTLPNAQPSPGQGSAPGGTPSGTGQGQQPSGPGGPASGSSGQPATLPGNAGSSAPSTGAPPRATTGPSAAATGPEAPASAAHQGSGRGRFSLNVFWLLAAGALLLLGLVVWVIVRLIQRLLPSYDREVRRSVTEGHPLVEMLVIPQNRRIGHRNVHYVKPDSTASVGSGRSKFLIYFVPVPRKMAQLEYDGQDYTFVPIKRELFPDIRGEPVPDCLGKSIPARSLRGYRFAIIFRKFIPPLVEINRLMRSVLPRPADGSSRLRGNRA